MSFAYGDADKKKRNECLRKAVESDWPSAMINYGLYLYYGDGMPKNKAKAMECFRKCARQTDDLESSATAKEILRELGKQ